MTTKEKTSGSYTRGLNEHTAQNEFNTHSNGAVGQARVTHETTVPTEHGVISQRKYVSAPDALVSNRLTAIHAHRLAVLLAALPYITTENGTARAEWFGGSYQGRDTLAELWSCSPKAVTRTLAALRAAEVDVSTGYRGFRHLLTIHYEATTDAQLPTAVADLATGDGLAIALYCRGSASMALTEARTVSGQAEALGVSQRSVKRARAALRALNLIGIDGRVARIKATTPERHGGHARGKPGGHEKGKRYREKPLSNTPTGLTGSLPPSGSTQTGDEGEKTHDRARTRPRGATRLARQTLTAMLANAGPTPPSRATGRALDLIADLIASGTSPDDLAAEYGGNLSKTHDPIGVLAHRLHTGQRHRNPEPTGRPAEQPSVIRVASMSEERMREILTKDELAEMGLAP